MSSKMQQFLERFKDVKVPSCPHCGRSVLAGPPCCYDALYELYQKACKEIEWLRKIQSKNAKRIQELAEKEKP